LKIVPVTHMDQVLELALKPATGKPTHAKLAARKKEKKSEKGEAGKSADETKSETGVKTE